MKALLRHLALLFGPIAGLMAQAPCSTCDGSGLSACRLCPAVEADVVACSVAASCRICQGALATPCADCVAITAVAAELQRRRRMAQEFLAGCDALLEDHGVGERGVLQCRSEHFDLLFAVGRIKGCPESDPHLQLHLYAARLEALRQRFVTRLGVADFAPVRMQIAVVKDKRDHRRLSHGLTGLEVQGLGGLRLDDHPAAVLLQTKSQSTDAALQGLLVHSATHLLLASVLAGSLDEAGHGWLEAGLAHWFEADQGGVCKYFCVLARVQSPQMFWGGDWKTGVRELLEAGMLPAVADVLTTDISDFDFGQHSLAFALVDFLLVQMPIPVTHDGGAVRPPAVLEVLAAARAGTPSSTALTQVLGRDLAAIEADFHSFVRARYPRR